MRRDTKWLVHAWLFSPGRQLRVAREAVWVQQTSGADFAAFLLEAAGLQAALAGLATSQDPFDHWFRELTREIHGIDLEQGFPPPEQTIDYRRARRTMLESESLATTRG